LGRVEDINGHFDQTPKRFLVRNSNIVFQGGDEVNPLLDIRVEYELPGSSYRDICWGLC